MKVELFRSAGCKRCAAAREALKAAAALAVPGIDWREIDAATDIDYAVALGVMSLPAVAVDGQLAFSTLPSPAQLADALRRRAKEAANGH